MGVGCCGTFAPDTLPPRSDCERGPQDHCHLFFTILGNIYFSFNHKTIQNETINHGKRNKTMTYVPGPDAGT